VFDDWRNIAITLTEQVLLCLVDGRHYWPIVMPAPRSTLSKPVASKVRNKTGTGEVAARMMAALYITLLEADPSKEPEQERGERAKGERPKKAERAPVAAKASRPAQVEVTPPSNPTPSRNHNPTLPTPQVPGININLEIHISADSTPEQIEQIFASMAKHIYKAG
jgi:hypothetical protein